MIKEIKIDELKKVAEFGELFFKEGSLPGKFNPSIFIKMWETFITNRSGVILGLFSKNGQLFGILGGLIYPDINSGDLTATEAFWFVKKDKRNGLGGIRLLKHFEKWAIARGAKRIIMVHLININPEKMEKYYKTIGYKPIETHYVKEV